MLGCVCKYAHPTAERVAFARAIARGHVARRSAAGFGDACVAVTASADPVWVNDGVNGYG